MSKRKLFKVVRVLMRFVIDATPRIAAFMTCLIPGCTHSTAGVPVDSKLLIGSWQLQTVDGKPPQSINVEEYTMTFSAEGKWMYTMATAGNFGGMTMEGDGTWQYAAGVIECAGGNNLIHRSKVGLQDGILTLDPDPLFVKQEENVFKTRYIRLVSTNAGSDEN